MGTFVLIFKTKSTKRNEAQHPLQEASVQNPTDLNGEREEQSWYLYSLSGGVGEGGPDKWCLWTAVGWAEDRSDHPVRGGFVPPHEERERPREGQLESLAGANRGNTTCSTQFQN